MSFSQGDHSAEMSLPKVYIPSMTPRTERNCMSSFCALAVVGDGDTEDSISWMATKRTTCCSAKYATAGTNGLTFLYKRRSVCRHLHHVSLFLCTIQSTYTFHRKTVETVKQLASYIFCSFRSLQSSQSSHSGHWHLCEQCQLLEQGFSGLEQNQSDQILGHEDVSLNLSALLHPSELTCITKKLFNA